MHAYIRVCGCVSVCSRIYVCMYDCVCAHLYLFELLLKRPVVTPVFGVVRGRGGLQAAHGRVGRGRGGRVSLGGGGRGGECGGVVGHQGGVEGVHALQTLHVPS